MTGNPCIDRLVAAGKITAEEARGVLASMTRYAERVARAENTTPEQALAAMEKGMTEHEVMLDKVAKRNTLLNIRAKNSLKNFARQFGTWGEGIRAFMEGTEKRIQGGRLSIDSRAHALHGELFGKLVNALDESGVTRDFLSGKIEREIFIEMGELRPGGKPGRSGSKAAREVAKSLHNNMGELVRRQNLAGAYITLLPGYIMRQSHDRSVIRALGGKNMDVETSYQAWKKFIIGKLDHAKTFKGMDEDEFLRKVHSGLFTGTHGKAPEAEMSYMSFYPSKANKLSTSRVLHFKDAEAAYTYNKEFGLRNLADAVFSDLFYRTRTIASMEALGPSPEATFRQALLELRSEARDSDKAAQHSDSLQNWKIEAAFKQALGINDHPENVSWHRNMSALRLLTQLSRMGGVTISSLTDKAFFQSEMAFNGVRYLKTLRKQIEAVLPKDQERMKALRLWGVALDGLIGNTISRYASHDTTSGWLHRQQRRFFDLNFLNWWTDNHKAAAADTLIAHLGEHSNLTHDKLPADLRNVLALYNISEPEWNAIRSVAKPDKHGTRWIMPDDIKNIPLFEINRVIDANGWERNAMNQSRARRLLENQLRTYVTDRVNYAVPTPGSSQRKYMTMGTQAGTPLGEVMRTLTVFKSFPTTILTKIIGRDVYGRGAGSLAEWVKSDHMGKFWVAHTIAAGTVLGYLSMVIRDMIRGRSPKELVNDDGEINWKVVNEAALRGGSLGILGDVLAQEYGRTGRGFLEGAAGPVFGQTETIARLWSGTVRGEFDAETGAKFFQDNIPYINLFYIRPILDYFVLWNLQEMLDPGSLKAYEERMNAEYGQEFWIKPSETVK